MRSLVNCLAALSLLPLAATSQTPEKHFYGPDSTKDYYLSIRPQDPIKGVVLLLTSNPAPEPILLETRLHSVAYLNSLLMVYASVFELVPDSGTINRINRLVNHIAKDFSADTSRFVLGGVAFAGNTALRYTELAYEQPQKFPIRPRAVFTAGAFVDLPELYAWCGREIRKSYFRGNVGDAQYILHYFHKHALDTTKLKELTPFDHTDTLGHERWLTGLPIRLYYDGDPFWEVQSRHNSLYDNPVAGGSELITHLLQAGNDNAGLMLSKQPGYRPNGIRNPMSLSIVDETECIQWITGVFNILNPALPQNWKAPYIFPLPESWTLERTAFPPDFSPNSPYKGFEEIHFPPGWSEATTEDYWTVSYLFRLEGRQGMDAARLQDFLKAYFEGLIADNTRRRRIPKEKLVPVNPTLAKARTEKGDLETYTGTISSFDYMAQVPMQFYCRIHLKPGGDSFTPLLIEISPKKFDHPIWQKMEATTEQFQCGTGQAN